MNKITKTINLILVAVIGLTLLPNTVFAIHESDYNSTGSTYVEHTPTTYTIGSGCASDTEGKTCYSGPEYHSILTEATNGTANNPWLVLYKNDIIEFVPDVAKSSDVEGQGFTLFKGFQIINGANTDITSSYATILEEITSGTKVVYQKIKITSDLPVQLLPAGAGGTGYSTASNSLRQTWSDRLYYLYIGQFSSASVPITYDLDGGTYYGSKTTPTNAYVTSVGYSFNLPIPYKEGMAFTGWKSSNALISIDSTKKIATVKGVSSWATRTQDGSISVRSGITLTAEYTSLSENDVTLTLNANGGTIGGYATRIYNTTIATPYEGVLSNFGISNYIPVKTNYTFDGWFLDSALTQKVNSDSDVSYARSDLTKKTLYAKWTPVVVQPTTYTITINSGTGFTVTPASPITVNENENKEITITASNGYRLKSVKVDNVEKTLPLTNNKLTLTNITKNMAVVVVAEKIVYKFDTDSKNQTYTIGTNTGLSLRVEDTTIDNFDKVYVNGVLLDQKHYEVKTGSIIVTLKDSYLKTLKKGTYNFKITTKDGGQALSSFVIANNSVKNVENPKTGDGIMNSILLGSISIIGILSCGLFLNKKKKYN